MPRYETPEQLRIEGQIADYFCKKYGFCWKKYTEEDVPDILCYNTATDLIGGAEIKRRYIKFGQYADGYMIDESKVNKLITFNVPTIIIVGCNDLCAYIKPANQNCRHGRGGRTDRDDPSDIDDVIFYAWKDFIILGERGSYYD